MRTSSTWPKWKCNPVRWSSKVSVFWSRDCSRFGCVPLCTGGADWGPNLWRFSKARFSRGSKKSDEVDRECRKSERGPGVWPSAQNVAGTSRCNFGGFVLAFGGKFHDRSIQPRICGGGVSPPEQLLAGFPASQQSMSGHSFGKCPTPSTPPPLTLTLPLLIFPTFH